MTGCNSLTHFPPTTPSVPASFMCSRGMWTSIWCLTLYISQVKSSLSLWNWPMACYLCFAVRNFVTLHLFLILVNSKYLFHLPSWWIAGKKCTYVNSKASLLIGGDRRLLFSFNRRLWHRYSALFLSNWVSAESGPVPDNLEVLDGSKHNSTSAMCFGLCAIRSFIKQQCFEIKSLKTELLQVPRRWRLWIMSVTYRRTV